MAATNEFPPNHTPDVNITEQIEDGLICRDSQAIKATAGRCLEPQVPQLTKANSDFNDSITAVTAQFTDLHGGVIGVNKQQRGNRGAGVRQTQRPKEGRTPNSNREAPTPAPETTSLQRIKDHGRRRERHPRPKVGGPCCGLRAHNPNTTRRHPNGYECALFN
ncbi:hypothetical protein ECG_07845 [Echinococcus granulosus]|nr:hypothetical protein ECG_07839 [Echinococcus granulosus]KAH9279438.1 hypothetical protein ECG_07836 [Echinococcus granulosus]KAH9279621.1 hypothetical protein ECG_07845 [Echinococcus granulosus]